jgi:hypothetical protein
VSESRIAKTLTDRRIGLEDFYRAGVRVTELELGESIHAKVYLADDTLHVEGDVSYGLITIERPGTLFERSVYGWYLDVRMPDEAQTITIDWTATIGNADDNWSDTIQVIARAH